VNTSTPSELKLAFRDAMASVCTPVSIVTAALDGLLYGTTVSAFASLSMEPPMLLVALDRGSDSLQVVRKVGRFGLNVLESSQSSLALTFSQKGGAGKFDGVPCSVDAGVPRLLGGLSFFSCGVENFVNGGDHVVLLGRVLSVTSSAGSPLTYHDRLFGTHVPLAGGFS
jgi:flavin reductase (DIM6/NTAB) family NADH-FMN oxidoreductase RutF